MLTSSIQNLLFALIVVVPGFVATQIVISTGVIRSEMSKWRILITSLAMSLVVVTLFLHAVDLIWGTTVSNPNEVSSIFFSPTFKPGLVIGLLLFSVVVGLFGGLLMAMDYPQRFREFLWEKLPGDTRRNFYEPWEGALNEASRVQVLTQDGALAVGSLGMWSDDGKEQQIALTSVEWHSPSTDGWVDSDTDIELFTGQDIQQVTVIDTKESVQEPTEDDDEEPE